MRLDNTIRKGNRFFTKNAYPGTRHFDERIIRIESEEYREWNPERSKLAAAMMKGISQLGLKQDYHVLYLGASHGYTPSFVSDVIGKKGVLHAVEFAPRVARDLYFIAKQRDNILPIIADCNEPENYQHMLTGADLIFQDIAQKNQVEILLKHFMFLKKGGFALLALKARSIDVTAKPKDIYKKVMKQLEEKAKVVDYRELDPIERDHAFFVVKK